MALSRKRSRVNNLIAELKRIDPKLHEAIDIIADDIESLIDAIEPLEAARVSQEAENTNPPTMPNSFGYNIINRETLRLHWIGDAPFYEVRKGTVWETALFVLRTSNVAASLDPVLAGTHDYMVKSISGTGVYSIEAATQQIIITGVGLPVVTASVIDNNVLLYWTEPTAVWWIDYYEVWKTVDSVRTKIGEVTGLFTSIFEQAQGEYLYEIIAFDIAGNEGPAGSIGVTVSNPPDFDAVGEIIQDNSLATLTAALYESITQRIYCPIDLTELYNAHFTGAPGGPWNSPNDQVAAGYDIWIQDNPQGTPAAVIEFPEVDFGASYENVILSYNYGFGYLTTPDQPTVVLKMKASNTPGGGSYVTGNNRFLSGPIRYCRVKLEINNASYDSMMYIEPGSVLSLDVKREVDSNNISCSSGDSGGTIVYTDGVHDATLGHSRKAFKSIDSITLTSKAQAAGAGEPLYFIFDDSNSPAYFKIYVFDASGIRVSQVVDWKVRGIV